MKRLLILTGLTLLMLQSINMALFAAGVVKGNVKDAQTEEALPYTNVMLRGTSLGSAADEEGNYVIKNIPAGTYTLLARYVGYKEKEMTVVVQDGRTTEMDFTLDPETVMGETVVVTAQAEGQMKAINEQLTSIALLNSVSAARIQELPDANAAESVGRLPGVSLVREGGEGSKVVVRGLSPQYNRVTIGGVELPSNATTNNMEDQSSFIGDRATDLSMISSSMLGGIQVTKAITPDMDASAIGGVVNFDLRKAQKNSADKMMYSLQTQGGYNELDNAYKDYKAGFTVERRLLNSDLGIFAQATAENRSLSDNQMGDSFESAASAVTGGKMYLQTLNVSDIERMRERYGATVVIDYTHTNGSIELMNFVSSSDTRSTNRSIGYNVLGNQIVYSTTDANNKLNVLTNIINIKQNLFSFSIDTKLSHTYSENKSPEDLNYTFLQSASAGFANALVEDPEIVQELATPDYDITFLDAINTTSNFSRDRALTAQMDLETEFTLSDLISTKFKFGGMYQYRKRAYDYEQGDGSLLFSGAAVTTYIQDVYPWMQNNGVDRTQLPIGLFLDPNHDFGDFLKGDYYINTATNVDLMWSVLGIVKEFGSGEAYVHNSLSSIINDYSGNETKSAIYAMTTINIGQDVTILPGIRYQQLETEYTAPRGTRTDGSRYYFQHTFYTANETHGYWLPMLHLRYKPFSWLQLQFAYTNTLNYPDFNSITPKIFIDYNTRANYNNYKLKPAQSENFDIIASIYNNEIGLFTVDWFQKNIDDLILPSDIYVSDISQYPGLTNPGGSGTWNVSTFINSPFQVNLQGIELDWQTSFWYLPFPFNGLVFNANFTHIFSEAKYPKSIRYAEYDDEGNVVITIVDTFYTSRLLNQPNDIINLGMGYDYKGFSARVSMLYKDDVFQTPDWNDKLRVSSEKHIRWDLSLKQNLPWYGIQIFFDLNNITSEPDLNSWLGNSKQESEQHYGMTGNLGVRITL